MSARIRWLLCGPVLACQPPAEGGGTPSLGEDYCELAAAGAGSVRGESPQGIVYELYVRSFQDSDGDGVGDLQGVIARLDHLASLQVETIWLLPVFPAEGPAGYDPTALDAVSEDYGTLDDLQELFAAAGDLGMGVILDVPLNHSSTAHPWFTAGQEDPDAPERSRYVLGDARHDELRWFEYDESTWYYAFFGRQLPDYNWRDPVVQDELTGALLDWMDLGAAGLRADAVVQLIEDAEAIGDTEESHCLMAFLMQELHAADPDAFVLAEAYHDSSTETAEHLGSEELPEADAVLAASRHGSLMKSYAEGQALSIEVQLDDELEEGASEALAGYLGSHDTDRVAGILDEVQLRGAFAAILLLPGPPVLYYGDEIGMRDAPADYRQIDELQRAPMLWSEEYSAGFTTGTPWFPVDEDYLEGRTVAAQLEDEDSLLRWVQGLTALRAGSAAGAGGRTASAGLSEQGVLAFTRGSEPEAVFVAVSFRDEALSLPLELRGDWVDLRAGGEPVADPDLLELEPWGTAVWASPELAHLALP